jgi:hypothetical protein
MAASSNRTKDASPLREEMCVRAVPWLPNMLTWGFRLAEDRIQCNDGKVYRTFPLSGKKREFESCNPYQIYVVAINIIIISDEEADKSGLNPLSIVYDLEEDEFGCNPHLFEKWALELNQKHSTK